MIPSEVWEIAMAVMNDPAQPRPQREHIETAWRIYEHLQAEGFAIMRVPGPSAGEEV